MEEDVGAKGSTITPSLGEVADNLPPFEDTLMSVSSTLPLSLGCEELAIEEANGFSALVQTSSGAVRTPTAVASCSLGDWPSAKPSS